MPAWGAVRGAELPVDGGTLNGAETGAQRQRGGAEAIAPRASPLGGIAELHSGAGVVPLATERPGNFSNGTKDLAEPCALLQERPFSVTLTTSAPHSEESRQAADLGFFCLRDEVRRRLCFFRFT